MTWRNMFLKRHEHISRLRIDGKVPVSKKWVAKNYGVDAYPNLQMRWKEEKQQPWMEEE